ncbi:MAG: hypothetical protein CME60_07530 [Halobacteriovoraceae bacterium]|nr:hypothetical protein [Halobacteriovoraceae bacterium]
MNLDTFIQNPIEREYFEGLLSQLSKKVEILKIASSDEDTGVYPTAIAPSEYLQNLPLYSYKEIKKKYSTSAKINCTLWLKKMHGGIGSSLKRDEYLKKHGRTQLGSKSTDLYIKTQEFGTISLAEAQIIQASKKTRSFDKVILQDLVNNDVRCILDQSWSKFSYLLNNNFERFPSVIQQKLPTIHNGELSINRVAPAGHGLFGYEAFKGPRPSNKNTIACIGNGEDLSSSPDKAIVNWMLTENIPVVMITTTKTERDIKGGQIALKKEGNNLFMTIVEKAQAEQANQLEYFQELGLRKNDKEAFFNTNIVLINYSAIDHFQIALPDLIQNKKGEFIQLEGAMGSVLLNSDKLARRNGKKLVHILNIPNENRKKFFNPIKVMTDFERCIEGKNYCDSLLNLNND